MSKSSVVIATYNGEKFIVEQLESLLNQTVKPNEVIINDDCSSDNTALLVERFIRKHQLEQSWHLFINDENIGYAGNFHKAIGQSSSEVVFLCDQDDLWENDKIEVMVEALNANPKIELLCCMHEVINKEGIKQKGILVSKQRNSNALRKVSITEVLNKYHWPGMAMAFRRDFYKSLPYSIAHRNIPHDFILALLASEKSNFFEIDYVGVYHRRHGNNAAREEHKVMRNLNRVKKLEDIDTYSVMLESILSSMMLMEASTIDKLRSRLSFVNRRKINLLNRDIIGVFHLYFSGKLTHFNLYSFLCDLWLAFFSGPKSS